MLAIDIDSDPISGLVWGGSEISTPFQGWIELAAVIEAARSADSHDGEALGEDPAETLGSFPGAKGLGL